MRRHCRSYASFAPRRALRSLLSLSSIGLAGLLGYGTAQLLSPSPAARPAPVAPGHAAEQAAAAILAELTPAAGPIPLLSELPAEEQPAELLPLLPEPAPAEAAVPAVSSVVMLAPAGAAAPAPVAAALPLPPAKPPAARFFRAPIERVVEVRRGDTLLSLLGEAGLGEEEARAAVDALRPVFSPKRLRSGQEIHLVFEPGRPGRTARLTRVSFDADEAQEIHLTRDAQGGFSATPIDKPLTLALAHAEAAIRVNLFQTGKRSGVPFDVMQEVIQALSYDVDFQRELHPNDRFEVIYERLEDAEGNLVKTGNLVFAALQLNDRSLALYRFTTADGQTDFYTRKGESIRKALLRTPIDGARLTSGFGMRKHPILGFSKMHKGVDFAAPIGTPIFAAGDGTIVELGRNGGYGNYVRIKHGAQYQTAYAHASRFAKGMKVGRKVRQGEVVAYVGTTGRSTGPHLHYEVLVDGSQVNPLSIKLAGRKLQGKELKRFLAVVAEIDRLRNGEEEAERVLVAQRP